MNKEILNALNAQIGHEYENYMLYEQASAYCDDRGLDESAKLFRKQADGEQEHARKFTDYVRDARGQSGHPRHPGPEERVRLRRGSVPGGF